MSINKRKGMILKAPVCVVCVRVHHAGFMAVSILLQEMGYEKIRDVSSPVFINM